MVIPLDGAVGHFIFQSPTLKCAVRNPFTILFTESHKTKFSPVLLTIPTVELNFLYISDANKINA